MGSPAKWRLATTKKPRRRQTGRGFSRKCAAVETASEKPICNQLTVCFVLSGRI
jgi:hypothetical protein